MNLLRSHPTLHKKASFHPEVEKTGYWDFRKDKAIGVREKKPIIGIKIIGDSLSDSGGQSGEYSKKILGCIPIRLFLHKSRYRQFTNGFVWEYPLIEKLKLTLKETAKPLDNPHLHAVLGSPQFSKNVAQGGSTAYNYGGFFNFFRYVKGFFLSFVLNNIQNQTKTLKESHCIRPEDLCVVFAGANDFVTVGYCDQGGVDRAIQGIAKALKTLTTPQEGGSVRKNYSKNMLLFTLPDFSRTPRFAKKSEHERKQAQTTCRLFNEKLRDLAKLYQYIDFSFCDIYQLFEKDSDLELDKIRDNIEGKGIIIVGKGSARTLYFINKKRLITRDSGEIIRTNVSLSKRQQKRLGSAIGKVERTSFNTVGLESLIHQLSSKAKLNADVKIFDAAAVFEEIDENSEAYGFTSGCAVYYLSETEGEATISQRVIAGNAILIQKLEGTEKFLCYFVKAGKLVKEEAGKRLLRTVELTLSENQRRQFDQKIQRHPLENGISQLASSEGKHDACNTSIIQAAVRTYEESFKEKIKLADIYVSILSAIKQHFPNQERIFWDDLHPTVTVHFLLELMFEKFFMDHYKIKSPSAWLDDTLIPDQAQPELLPKAYEAPARIHCNR